ncbi:MAG: alginate lyase family protein [Bryobacterales bacterium]|nr:alginate lyase family protein [Bryobacterales bacterium]
MSGSELRTRLAQETSKRLDSLRAVLRLPPAAPRRRPGGVETGRFFFAPSEIPAIVEQIRKRSPAASKQLKERADKIVERRFDLLGYQGLDFGREINWSLDPVSGRSAPDRPWPNVPYLDYAVVGDHKVTWELGRHQHLVTLVRAWRLTGEKRYRDEAIAQYRDWKTKNPYPRGIHWTSALEVAFRAISWMWLYALLDREGPKAQEILGELEESCGHAAYYLERYLSYYFSPNTHLLGEAVALYALGQLFRGFEAADKWREKGREVVLEQAGRQVRPDGLYFEQSLYYHVYAIDFLIFFRLIAERNSDPLPSEIAATTGKMAEMLLRLSQGGAPPRFGDDDGGRLFDQGRNRTGHMLDPLSTCALLHGRADLKAAVGEIREETLWLAGAEGGKRWDALVASPSKPSAYRHDDGGWHVLVSGEQPPSALLFDAGPLGALSGGHGHADALSVQLIRNGRDYLTDPGTGRYPHETPERNRFRSTAAHSTLTIDGRGQAEPRGSFGWDRMPQAATELFLDGRMLDFVVARHDAYAPLVHRRWALLFDSGLVFVRDVVEGSGRHAMRQVWRLGAGFRIRGLEPGKVAFEDDRGERLICVSPRESEWAREIYEADWSPCYGQWESAPVVEFHAESETPCERAFVLSVGESAGEYALDVPLDGRGRGLSVYRYSEGETERTLYFQEGKGAWEHEKLRSDARLLVRERRGKTRRVFAAFASFLEAGGKEVFRDAAPLDRFEWSSDGGADASSAAVARKAKTDML